MVAWLSGKKTYLFATCMLVKVVVDYVLGHGFDSNLVLEALVAMGLRAGIAKA